MHHLCAEEHIYDARGNVTNNGPTTFVYDFANQPTALTGLDAAAFAYDGNLKRVKEVRGGKTYYTVYSRAAGGLVYRDEASDDVKTDYASAGGAAIRLVTTGTGTPVADYSHFDAQGSVVADTRTQGVVLWRESYEPFGRTRLNPAGNADDTGYTGHLKDSASGLIYMQARYYDPLVPRFLSTDPIGYQDQLNLYAYVANDPVNKTDPTGEKIGDPFDTPEEAGRDAVADVNPRSIQENREYGGRVRREVTVQRDSKGNVQTNRDGSPKTKTQYYATDPVGGDHDSTSVGPSDSTSDVGDYHTHGDYSKTDGTRTDKAGDQYDSERFSPDDKDASRSDAAASKEYRRQNGETYRSYLGTPSGDTKEFVPEPEYQR